MSSSSKQLSLDHYQTDCLFHCKHKVSPHSQNKPTIPPHLLYNNVSGVFTISWCTFQNTIHKFFWQNSPTPNIRKKISLIFEVVPLDIFQQNMVCLRVIVVERMSQDQNDISSQINGPKYDKFHICVFEDCLLTTCILFSSCSLPLTYIYLHVKYESNPIQI